MPESAQKLLCSWAGVNKAITPGLWLLALSSVSGATHRTHSSMRVATWRSTLTALSGYAPTADSPDSISASARCRTTSEMSATCARRSPTF